ncbi:MAG: hypothetical protein E6Q97_00010 [Desulfurellales bacterium]|nr:MAG: hypothetical protein E6Q97_00010 [Desulfurellales bacterium]
MGFVCLAARALATDGDADVYQRQENGGDVIDLRLGKYSPTLDNEAWDALICDPPYSEKTHVGMRSMAKGDGAQYFKSKTPVAFDSWSRADAMHFAWWAARRTRQWVLIMCSHDLWSAYDEALRDIGGDDETGDDGAWYRFAPIPIVADTVRLGGDGPASTPAWAFVARRRNAEKLGSTPSPYKDVIGKNKSDEGGIVGGKGIALMRKIVCDYSRPGWRICDPTAGAGTTAIACALEGRDFIGSEMDAGRHALALSRIAKHSAQQDLFDAK